MRPLGSYRTDGGDLTIKRFDGQITFGALTSRLALSRLRQPRIRSELFHHAFGFRLDGFAFRIYVDLGPALLHLPALTPTAILSLTSNPSLISNPSLPKPDALSRIPEP